MSPAAWRRSSDMAYWGLFVAIVVLIAYLALAFVLRGAQTFVQGDLSTVVDCTDDAWASELGIELDPQSGCPDVVDISLGVQDVDVNERMALVTSTTLYPSGSFGGNIGNGAWALKSIIVTADATDFGEWLIPSNSFVGTQSLALPLSPASSLVNYPFDEYEATLTGLTLDAVEGERIPVVQTVAPNPIPGFDVVITRQEMEGTVRGSPSLNPRGRFGYILDVARDPSVKFQVLLLTITSVLGALAAIMLSGLVFFGKRPPSISGLSWLATFLFALLEVRRNFPGSPPIGVRIDAWITLPVAVILTSLIALNAIIWLKRQDWDLKNRTAVHPQ